MKLYMRANKNAASRCVMIFLALVPMTLALAQLTSVPMKDVGNEWVKQLSLKGRMDWGGSKPIRNRCTSPHATTPNAKGISSPCGRALSTGIRRIHCSTAAQ